MKPPILLRPPEQKLEKSSTGMATDLGRRSRCPSKARREMRIRPHQQPTRKTPNLHQRLLSSAAHRRHRRRERPQIGLVHSGSLSELSATVAGKERGKGKKVERDASLCLPWTHASLGWCASKHPAR
jgi:hypothetical protein